MKNLILIALAAIFLIGGTALAQREVMIDLKCNGKGHNDGRWVVVDGPFSKIADCDRAAKRHRDSHSETVRTQCSFR